MSSQIPDVQPCSAAQRMHLGSPMEAEVYAWLPSELVAALALIIERFCVQVFLCDVHDQS